MTLVIRHLIAADQPVVTKLLDDVVGRGQWSFERADSQLSCVAITEGALAGALLACLSPASGALPPEVRTPQCAVAVPDLNARIVHVRQLAVAPGHRRRGVAGRLLRHAEEAGRAGGASLALVYAWLPSGRSDPESVAFYLHEGFVPSADIDDFYADWSLESGATCPYCGSPPCRCGARVFVKPLLAPA